MADPSVSFKEERVTKPHSRYVYACAISPDGSLIATGSDDNMTCVIDAATGNVMYTVKHRVSSVAWHPDGNRCLSTCADGSFTEITQLNEKWAHQPHSRNASLDGCAVSASGLVAIACAAGGDKSVVILDSKYSFLQLITGLADLAWCVSFSSNGALVAIGCYNGTHYVYGYHQASGQYKLLVKRNTHKNRILSLSFSPSDSHLIMGSDDCTASLWNVPSTPMTKSAWPQSPAFILTGHSDTLYGTCFTGDGRHVITASFDQTIRIWRVSDGSHVGTLDALHHVYSASFNAATGRLICGLEDGSLQSWLCPLYDPSVVPPLAPPVPSFVDAHLRLSNAHKDVKKIEGKLSLIDPSVRDAGAKAAQLCNEITRLQEQIDEHKRELALIETDAMKESLKNIKELEEQLEFANGEIFNCKRIIDHVSECYDGYFSSLQAGVFFDQWLFDSKLGHLCGKFKELDGDRLVQTNIIDLENDGLSYIESCDIHIRACVTVHMHQVGELPDVFNWDREQVSTWLESQGPAYASLVNQGWTGPSLIALSLTRIEAASNKSIKSEQATALKEKISALVKHDSSLLKWMRIWNGGQSVAAYGEF